MFFIRQREKQVDYIDSFREYPVGERIWIDIIEYILELLPELISRDRRVLPI